MGPVNYSLSALSTTETNSISVSQGRSSSGIAGDTFMIIFGEIFRNFFAIDNGGLYKWLRCVRLPSFRRAGSMKIASLPTVKWLASAVKAISAFAIKRLCAPFQFVFGRDRRQ